MELRDLLRALDGSQAERETAATSLGLLLDREATRRPAGGDGGLRDIAGDEVAAIALDEKGRRAVIDALSKQLDLGRTEPILVWALSKARDPESGPRMQKLVHSFANARDARGQADVVAAQRALDLRVLRVLRG
jgi:hypothetical protein